MSNGQLAGFATRSPEAKGTRSLAGEIGNLSSCLERLEHYIDTLCTLSDRINGPSPRQSREAPPKDDSSVIEVFEARLRRFVHDLDMFERTLNELQVGIGSLS